MPTCRLQSEGNSTQLTVACSYTSRHFPVCTRTISRLLQRLLRECHRCWVHLLFFRDPLLIYLRRGFTCGGRTELKRTENIFQRSFSDMFGKTAYSNCLLLFIVELQKGEYYLNLSNPNRQEAAKLKSSCCCKIPQHVKWGICKCTAVVRK